MNGTQRTSSEVKQLAQANIKALESRAALLLDMAAKLRAGGLFVASLRDYDRLLMGGIWAQIDMRFAKILRFGSKRLDIGVDLSNLLNTNYATTYENTYQTVGVATPGGTWGNPTAVYSPRFVRCPSSPTSVRKV